MNQKDKLIAKSKECLETAQMYLEKGEMELYRFYQNASVGYILQASRERSSLKNGILEKSES